VLGADAALDANWHLEAAAPGVQLQCSAGRRGATEEECLAAVREAASRDGLEVAGFKSVNDGAAGVVPAGCSYSVHTKYAMFNTDAAGGVGQGNYQLVCRASA
jgi:aspartyl aminopeptidase